MPNTPAQIGLGVTGLYPSQCSNYEKSFVDQLFSGCGRNVWLDDEAQINHIIAVSGSAPAYFFYFMQAMQQVAGATEMTVTVERQGQLYDVYVGLSE